MRARTLNYFLGSLLSRQVIYAYGIAGGITTAIQLLLITNEYLIYTPRSESLPIFLDLYIETLLPLWAGGISTVNVVVFITNVIIALLILLKWTANYAASY